MKINLDDMTDEYVMEMALKSVKQVIKRNEHLQKALRLAAGELSRYGEHTNTHPEDLYKDILDDAGKQ